MSHSRVVFALISCALVGASAAELAAQQAVLEPGQLAPYRLYSIGDSLTRAANANLLGDNLSASWVNGYRRTAQKLLGLPNVYSHNQRIDDLFGKSGRSNITAAYWGARVDDWAEQAANVVHHQPTYATVMLGGNDLCRDDPATLPTNEQFEANVREGMQVLVDGLPQGATALVVLIPNARKLYDIGMTKEWLGITSCRTLWKLTGFCEALLNDRRTEADRDYIAQRNVEYNEILERVTQEHAAANKGRKFIRSDGSVWQLPYAENHISDSDCFHLAWRGQRAVSELTWPFRDRAQAPPVLAMPSSP